MKRILSIILAVLMMASVLVFASCGNTEPGNAAETTLKMGLGVYSAASKASNADGETNGNGQVAITAAAVLVDADGKVVKCVIDTADNKVAYTSEGIILCIFINVVYFLSFKYIKTYQINIIKLNT